MAKGDAAKAAWKIAGDTAGAAATGAVLSLLFNGASDLTTLFTWAAIGGGLGLLHGISKAAEMMTREEETEQPAESVETGEDGTGPDETPSRKREDSGPRNGPAPG